MMIGQYIQAKISILPSLFLPTYDAVFSRIPFWQRWRTLLLQPLNLLAALLTAPTWLFNNRYSVIYVPTRGGGKRRCLVYLPPRSGDGKGKNDLRPLHIDIHGGAFIGGNPEQSTRWCTLLSNQTGAVVISLSYRLTPGHIYPAAHNDIDDILTWLLSHCSSLFNANPSLLTLSGSSVGGSLALSASQFLHGENKPMPKAWVGFYPALDLRLRPEEKQKPLGFPAWDPLAFLMPMYDVYAGTEREGNRCEARLHSTLAERKTLPRRLLFVVAGIDVLVREQLEMVRRLEAEAEAEAEGERERKREGEQKSSSSPELFVVEKGFHGFLELPKWIMEKERLQVFDKSIKFIKDVHREHGFDIDRVESRAYSCIKE